MNVPMDCLSFKLKDLTIRCREGSFATQAARARGLQAIAKELGGMGYQLPGISSLKPKHVNALVARWKGLDLNDATIRNRLGWVRWWAMKANKPGLIPNDNAVFGLAERTPYQGNKARSLTPDVVAKVKDPATLMALRLQAAFGLRREEALKLRPERAIQGDRLCLKASWTKGGRYREIPIIHERQRALLGELRALVRDGSLIGEGRRYVDAMQTYRHHTRMAGLGNAHGLRHAWAQWQYKARTGRPCPAAGGPTLEGLAPAERQRDYAARLEIARELGHNRIDVTDTYLGRRYQVTPKSGRAA
jgi:integrase